MVNSKNEFVLNEQDYLVSVIIPFYSNKKWLHEALESVYKQTYKNLEIIIINDGSKENIDDLIKINESRIKYFIQENRGPGAARNFGIKYAQGSFIAFLDSDDLWSEKKIATQVSYMLKTGYKWSHTDYKQFGRKNNYIKTKIRGWILPSCLIWNPIATPCVMINSEILNSNNFIFLENTPFGEDNYLWENIGLSYQLGHIPLDLTYVRIRDINTAFNGLIMLKARSEKIKRVIELKYTFKNKILYIYFLSVLYLANFFNIILSVFFKSDKLENYIIRNIYRFFYSIIWVLFRVIR